MVLAADVFGPGEGVLVEPGELAVPVDGADSCFNRSTLFTLVGMSTILHCI